MVAKKQAQSVQEVKEAIDSLIANHKAEVSKKNGNRKVPLSESLPGAAPQLPAEVQDKMTAEDCCNLLRQLVEADPNHVISRNYFRVWGGIKESTWNKFFGTFEEFKRQAGIKLSRHVHRLERELAKHASVDHYRQMEEERRSWGDKYDKPSDERYQTILAAADFHDMDVDPFALRVLLDVAKRASNIIKIVSLVGDVFDLPEFGRFDQDPRDWGVSDRIKFTHNSILSPLREALPTAQIDFIEGNHEARLLRHLADATPAMKAVLSDLHGMTVPSLLGLDNYQVNYIGRSSLAAWTQRDMKKELERNWKVYFDCVLAHHFTEIGSKKGLPGFSGHSHKLLVKPLDNPLYGPGAWYQMGGMHVRQASYTDGERWSNGFMLVHVDTKTKRSVFEYIDIGDMCYVGGKFYERTEEERVIPTVR